jgi:hypothetical protein
LKTAQNRHDLKEAGVLNPRPNPNIGTVAPARAPTTPARAATNNSPKAANTKKAKGKTVSAKKSKKRTSFGSPVSSDGIQKRVSPTTKKPRLEVVSFEAVKGKQHIHKYALELISLVCSQSDPNRAHQVLDTPTHDFTIDNEPEKERLMRLQLRQRFASGISMGITPVEFARKLLALWGGKLVPRKSRKKSTSKQQKSTSSYNSSIAPPSAIDAFAVGIGSANATTPAVQPTTEKLDASITCEEEDSRDTETTPIETAISGDPSANLDSAQPKLEQILGVENANVRKSSERLPEVSFSEKARSEGESGGKQ